MIALALISSELGLRMIKQIIGRVILLPTGLLALIFVGQPAKAEETQTNDQTLLEIGVGVSIVDIPHYAGSEESEQYALPFPFFKYQSKKVSLNRDGLKRYLMRGENWDLDLSFSGTIPLDSDDNRAREGMPDLDWVGLVGPAFNYSLYRNKNHELKLTVPLRFGVATDFRDFDYVGWDFSPKVQWRTKIKNSFVEWNTTASFELEYADSKYNSYYYSVDDAYVTETRDAYFAESGFGGYKMTLGINRREGNFWIGAFTRYRNLSDAKYVNSPLVTTEQNFYSGLAVAWIFKSVRY